MTSHVACFVLASPWLATWLWLVTLAISPIQGSPPNILLIVSEDNGPELGCYGDSSARTPNLDQLASEGVRFDRAFVPQAGCSQSRASLLTGLYPHQHGQIGLATWGFRLYHEDFPTLPALLKNAGFRTGIIGKLHVEPTTPFPFDFKKISLSNFSRKNLADYAKVAGEFFREGDTPFFLSINFPDAHDPWLRQVDGLPESPQDGEQVRAMGYMGIDPPGMREMVADYYNSLARLDACIGLLLHELQKSGKADNTLVVYMGDHGADMLRGKRTCFDGGIRVPLLVRWPGYTTQSIRSELVSTLDLMPTFLSAAGVAIPQGLPGRPLQPLLKAAPVEWREQLFFEYHTHGGANNYFPQRGVRTDRYKLIENLLPGELHPDFDLTIRKLNKDAKERGILGGLDLATVIQQAPEPIRSAYQEARQPPRYLLYDLSEDPYEFRNLAGDPSHSETLRSLQSLLDQWRRDSRDPLLDPANLEKLTREVRAVKTKAKAQEVTWGYPYFFQGKEVPEKRLSPPSQEKDDQED
jgi:N-sulfoglucosamine sulfohydrolase